MKTLGEKSFNALVEHYLGARLPRRLSEPISISALPVEARAVVLRLLALMKRSACPATEINSHMIRLLATVTPAMLPAAWGGRIPPVTAAGRHRKLDEYVHKQIPAPVPGTSLFVDLGCGFPPATTVETAERLADWSVVGIDRSFPRHAVYDTDGNYACFNRSGTLQYLQTPTQPLSEHSQAVKDRFNSLFSELRPQLQGCDEHSSAMVEKDGNRLVCHPIRGFEKRNLKFVRSDIDDLQLPLAGVVRCMNVLLYFPKEIRQSMLAKIFTLIDEGGLVITGFNHPFGIYARYSVYTKHKAGVRPLEFAFSPDNLRPLGIGPWLTLADQDREAELLADLTGAIRDDRRFWPDFSAYVDMLRTKLGICDRDDDGFIHFGEAYRNASSGEAMAMVASLWRRLEDEGYTDGAIDALGRAGYQAWKNPVGDIAVVPPDGRPRKVPDHLDTHAARSRFRAV